MTVMQIVFAILIFFAATDVTDAQELNSRSRWETLNLIRNEKFDILLPQVMRDNNIGMWIHVFQQWKTDPMGIDLGVSNGYFSGYIVFTDTGNDRIERAILGRHDVLLQMTGAYDTFMSADDLKEFVSERDPQRIGINMSDKIAVANGLSHSGYRALLNALGDTYSQRIVSAEKLISDFRSKRVSSEIRVFTQAADFARRFLEQALSNEVITPGVTTREDVGWWVQDQMLFHGMVSSFGLSMPGLIHSYTSSAEEYRKTDYSIQRGDLMQFHLGVNLMNYGTDAKRHAYVLREGETDVPREFKQAFEESLRIRDLIKEHLKPGKTGVETLEYLYRKVEDAGYVRQEVEDRVQDTDIIEVNIGMHSVGNLGHDVGPSLWIDQPWRIQFILEPSNLFSFEIFTYPTIKEWGGKKARIGLEDDAVFSVHGVEWLYPVNDGVLLIK